MSLGAQQPLGAGAGAARRRRARASSTRIEFRAPDPACNPYLAFSVMLAAGLKGIDEGYELPPEADGQHLRAHADERARRGHRAAARSRWPTRST